jgi:hypothetical protein
LIILISIELLSVIWPLFGVYFAILCVTFAPFAIQSLPPAFDPAFDPAFEPAFTPAAQGGGAR